MKTLEEIFDKALQDRGINRIGLQVFGAEIYEAGLDAIKQALTIPDVSGSAEADYWSNRCKLVEDIWENTPSGDHIEELAELEQDYHKFIKENGNRHYR